LHSSVGFSDYLSDTDYRQPGEEVKRDHYNGQRKKRSYYSGITRNTEMRRGCTEFHGEKKTKFAHNTMF